ncbi:serine phosphatase RsbU (regulator of sigma subunit) [Halopolyspora algeriensis]|uniref:Serine phosphatase RsbU (Regulator of sigma subunit) n=1 Tax=Halopolyspora algeriensis TaxID=1500506 RepID=A0A368VF98_9ACTN|nr:GAF domain-containing SpoIIE family protein phosphatase [Halopolyspora algeriensis]RCW39951.1 serine phosphatase RsbU (regulator of sigma subunit) [Halopolyspora algeriensis]TQM46612.1 serine phosphatase RsbU (regulator of sigma subunit) [Halopolyspora algeriensis]
MSNSVDSVGSAEERLQQITRVTDTALAHLDFEALLHELLERVRGLLGVDTAAVLLHDDQRQQLVATAAAGIEEEVRQGIHIPVGKGFAGTVAERKQPLVLDHVDSTTVINPLFWEKGVSSLLGVPMLANGALVGVLHVGAFAARRFTEHDTHLLQLVADRIALATEASTSRTERAAAAALHRSLLPAQLPEVSGTTLAARYVPGDGTGVGGDWYDVFTLPTGRIGIVIGDVVGQGLSAAVVMGRLRSALRAYALETEDPGRTLDKLDRKVTHFEAHAMATVAYAIFEPSTNQLRLSLAGHPAPVRALPAESAALVDIAVDPPIGFGIAHRPRRTSFLEVPPGAAVCFYTDGLVERRDSSIDAGLERLCKAVAAAPAESICTSVMSKLVGSASVNDDIALFVLSRQTADTE